MQYYKHGLKATLQPRHEFFDIYGRGKCKRLILSELAAFISISFLLVSCGREPTASTPDERRAADSIVRGS